MIRRSDTDQSGIILLELLLQISFEHEGIKPDTVDLETCSEPRVMQLITRMVENIAFGVQCKLYSVNCTLLTVHTVHRSAE